MGQDMKNRSRVCPLPPGPMKDMNRLLKPRTIMAVSLSLLLATSGLAYYLIQPKVIPGGRWDPWKGSKVYTSHDPIWIEGDANFTAAAALEGWPGNGTPENPFIIDGLEIARMSFLDIDYEGHCIFINNTRASFIISNCNLTGAGCHMLGTVAAGITLQNVSSGLLVNNIFQNNEVDILLQDSHSNTVVNNTCYGNGYLYSILLRNSHSNNVTNNTCNNEYCGITLWESDSNTLANNTCNDNEYAGIIFHKPGFLGFSGESHLNTVVNNTCTNNTVGISIIGSLSNTIMNNTCSNNNEAGIYLRNVTNSEVVINTCNNNDIGIAIHESSYNTIVLNICNYNRIGIYLGHECGYSNIVVDNTCLGNTAFDIFEKFADGDYTPEVPPSIMFVMFAGFIMTTLLVSLKVGNRLSKVE